MEITDDGIDEHDSKNDRCVHPFAQRHRDACGCEQDVNERLVKLQKKTLPFMEPPLHGHLVRAKLLQPLLDFRLLQASGRGTLQKSGDFI